MQFNKVSFGTAFKFYFLIFSMFNIGEYSFYGNLVSPNCSPIMHFLHFLKFIYLYLHDKVLLNLNLIDNFFGHSYASFGIQNRKICFHLRLYARY